MDVPTITMDPAAAKAKLQAYRAAKHKDAEGLYKSAAAAYAELAKGTILLNLSDAIRSGGYFPDGLPKLAIARADRPEVFFRQSGGTESALFTCSKNPTRGELPYVTTLERVVDLQRKPPNGYMQGFALVPMVPPDVRPKTGQLREWHILFEVEKWYASPKHMAAPTDPLLLRHIGGELYAVLAEWDLTPVERMILEQARNR